MIKVPIYMSAQLPMHALSCIVYETAYSADEVNIVFIFFQCLVLIFFKSHIALHHSSCTLNASLYNNEKIHILSNFAQISMAYLSHH